MPRTARRERLRQITQQEILTTAERIAREDGWHGLTIRKVAEAVDYSPAMVYQFFDSKEAILEQLLQNGFQKLFAMMQQAEAQHDEPEQRALAIAEAYWDFAVSNPQLYQLMHGASGVPVNAGLVQSEIQRVCGLAQNALEVYAATQGRKLADSYEATEVMWAIIHGLVSLSFIGRIGDSTDHNRALMTSTLRDLLRAWMQSAEPL